MICKKCLPLLLVANDLLYDHSDHCGSGIHLLLANIDPKVFVLLQCSNKPSNRASSKRVQHFATANKMHFQAAHQTSRQVFTLMSWERTSAPGAQLASDQMYSHICPLSYYKTSYFSRLSPSHKHCLVAPVLMRPAAFKFDFDHVTRPPHPSL